MTHTSNSVDINQLKLCWRNDCGKAREIADKIGHDRIGHHIVNRLVWARITTAEKLRSMTDEDLIKVSGIGANAVRRIREKIK